MQTRPGWAEPIGQQAPDAGAIMRGGAHRGIEQETAVLPSKHLADIVWLDQSAGGEAAQDSDG
jgi:hypothetical protein